MKVVFSKGAETDLTEIVLFIAQDNKSRALSFIKELRRAARQLGELPRAYPLIPRYEHYGIRRRPYGRYPLFIASKPTELPSFTSCTPHVITKRSFFQKRKRRKESRADLL